MALISEAVKGDETLAKSKFLVNFLEEKPCGKKSLDEIVNVLHRYVQDDDMMVDFCCGANDFNWLMKRKLDEIGKKCLYKNYDVLQPKNDFNFEKRDWTTVQPNELLEGSRLIMRLNPPFGVLAYLANKFIDKALEFKPKLLILTVPKETERLDLKKKMPYDLIWENNELLAASSYKTRPSENDLISHMALISEAVKMDETLAKSKVNDIVIDTAVDKILNDVASLLETTRDSLLIHSSRGKGRVHGDLRFQLNGLEI